mmetsp:Transcript_69122/g.179616  ORF Transcript_69122/g.179616 Transcript_69122/m.179616 type:complete len:161 (+) Transcript_69122:96-578(+)|eukprot:CAMPEP_0115449426 /NCGR_PEP_ID=MMETSP0271-20121206/41006_1 /TAXON_ID=71861 /ORGANISM="Scrippsiella trochoidea, Strain CCMP3099" /LENGTH=160 /DNA_ID=CAMNT_0002875589 /DNA_START=97 /DNA_END=579 /DNA_ORIENTATION=+
MDGSQGGVTDGLRAGVDHGPSWEAGTSSKIVAAGAADIGDMSAALSAVAEESAISAPPRESPSPKHGRGGRGCPLVAASHTGGAQSCCCAPTRASSPTLPEAMLPAADLVCEGKASAQHEPLVDPVHMEMREVVLVDSLSSAATFWRRRFEYPVWLEYSI